MPFWGIEVKPGKPYAYPNDSAHTKLRISQASIGTGKSNARSTLQINVGDNKPVILCNLLPNICENFSMDLEFEESETVLFSVLGERSVHLAGYHINTPNCKLDGNDSDSIGEDICHTESSGSDDDCSDLDRYESDFIDDDDGITNSPSPKYTSKERKEPSCRNASSRRLKKTCQVSDYDDYKPFDAMKSTSIFNSESDDSHDSMPPSPIPKKKEKEKKKSNAKVSLNTNNSTVVAVDAEETNQVSESCLSKETKIGQESNRKTEKKKKKNKKGKEEEEDTSIADKNAKVETDKRNKAKKQKETSKKDETRVEENQKEKASKLDEDGGNKKRRKEKKHGESSEPKMSENSLVTKATDSEVSVVPSDATQQNGIKGSKKSKKRSKDERPCESEVANEDHSDAKKPKKGDDNNEER